MKDFYSIFNLNLTIKSNTLFLCEPLDGSFALMRVMAKIEKHYKGELLVDDINLKKISSKKLDLAYLPSTPILFKNLTAKQNILYPLKLRKIKPEIQQQKYDEIKQKFPIKIDKKKAKDLSVSEAKIVCLIRALIRQPKIVLLENFFEDFDEKHMEVASKIIAQISTKSLVVACEKEMQPCFENFDVLHLQNGSIL